jgi:hypothetical protein
MLIYFMRNQDFKCLGSRSGLKHFALIFLYDDDFAAKKSKI